MKTILMPLPSKDFDPTESAIPWNILKAAEINIVFATPNGKIASCDQRMLNGKGLGLLAPLLCADKNARKAYQEMTVSQEFQNPMSWNDIHPEEFSGIILPGGHAPGMREYLESAILQKSVNGFFELKKPVGAICHGVVLAARSKLSNGKSSLYGRKTTALLASQELAAWSLTCLWLGDYYRTYSQTVESEVTSCLADPKDFLKGPAPLFRDSSSHLSRGFVVRDGSYLSARWPGDAHVFGNAFLEML